MVGLWLVAGGGGEEWLGRDGLAAEPARGEGGEIEFDLGYGAGIGLTVGVRRCVGLGFVPTPSARDHPAPAETSPPPTPASKSVGADGGKVVAH